MARNAVSPPLELTFDRVYQLVAACAGQRTPPLQTTGGVQFVAQASVARDGRRFISLPHNNRIYEHDWGYSSNSMGKDGQRIGHYSAPLDEWARRHR
jgi:hypothetical protein